MEQLKTALKVLQAACSEAVVEGERLKQTINIPEICAFYKSIYNDLDALEGLTGIIRSIKEEYSKKVIPTLLEAQDVTSIKTAGKHFILMPEFRANMSQEQQEKGLAWLREKGYGGLIKEGINASTLSAAIKEYVTDKGELPPEDIMSIHMGHYVSMRKAK